MATLAQTLAPELAGDAEAVRLLPRFDDPGTLILLGRRWRARHDQAVLVVDQVEELFTLNTLDVQRRFTEVLGRLVLEADVHVILSLRDDFLLQCQLFEELHPVFAELIPLTPPVGEALRRALVQPAQLSGYRFEDERLADDIVQSVAQERGALPLLAFAMARLWEHRDRELGLLTRRGYEEIGGVAGALAQHAEATLETIGAVRLPIVREIFRALVTAEGTRAPRALEELLSAFPDQRGEAEEVLGRLVEARLLTSFEAPLDEAGTGHRRVEIIHESLLAAWPRLVRWRDQDAEGAHLRDQLRQAARLWAEREKPIELLWSGPSFAEYLVWKGRYTGRLTALEQAFGRAMEAQAGRRRLRTRLGIGATFAALLVVLAVVSQLWVQSRASEQRAVQEARRAEAQQLLAMALVEEDENPNPRLRHALAALERGDSQEIRRFALRQLWKGPLSFVVSEGSNEGVFEPRLQPRRRMAGRLGELIAHVEAGRVGIAGYSWFVPAAMCPPTSRVTGRRLVVFGRRHSAASGVDVLDVPGADQLLEQIETPGERAPGRARRSADFRDAASAEQFGWRHRLRSLATRSRTKARIPVRRRATAADRRIRFRLSHLVPRRIRRWSRRRLNAGSVGAAPRAPDICTGQELLVGGDGVRIAWSGVTRVHSTSSSITRHDATATADRSLTEAENQVLAVSFDAIGRWVASAVAQQGLQMWDMTGPPDTEPIRLRRGAVTTTTAAVFEPSGRWLAAEDLSGVAFWPATRRWPSVLRVSADQPRDVAFDSGGKWIAAACRTGGVEIWPLTPDGPPRRSLVKGVQVTTLAVSPDGQFLATGTTNGSLLILPVSGSGPRELRAFQGMVWSVAFDETGRRIAANGRVTGGRSEIVRVFDLQTGHAKDFDPGDGKDIASVAFLPDGGLLTSSFGGLRRLDMETGSSERLLEQQGHAFLGPDGRYVLLLRTSNPNYPEGSASVYDLRERRGWPLASHGNRVTLMAWDPSGTRVVTGSRDGIVRVGPVTGEEPQLLIGHEGPIWGVGVDPTGRFVASTSEDGTVRIWPRPDGQPLHTWSRDALLEKFRSLTNVRIVEDSSAATGYRATFLPFQGWHREPPTW